MDAIDPERTVEKGPKYEGTPYREYRGPRIQNSRDPRYLERPNIEYLNLCFVKNGLKGTLSAKRK